MRVLYFHQHFSTPEGSAGTRSYEFARRLIDRGNQVTMVCSNNSMCCSGLTDTFRSGRREGEVDGIRVIEFNISYSNHDDLLKRTLIFFKYAIKSSVILWQEPHDIVYASSTPLTAGIPGIVASWFRRTPFVFEVRDLWPELPKAMRVITNPIVLWTMRILESCTYRSAEHIVGLAPGIVKGIESKGIDASRISMIPNGCDLKLFDPSLRQVQNTPRLNPDDFHAIYAGAHGVANGLEQLLEVAKVLKRLGRSEIKLVFVGDGACKNWLISSAKEAGLDNCIFIESVSKNELASILWMADVGLMVLANVPAFYYGTSPNKYFDYIASGLPVITNYPGWLAELIEEHFCGVVVPPGEAAMFARGLIYLCDQPEVRAQMSVSSRHLAETTFDRLQLANQFVEVIEKIQTK